MFKIRQWRLGQIEPKGNIYNEKSFANIFKPKLILELVICDNRLLYQRSWNSLYLLVEYIQGVSRRAYTALYIGNNLHDIYEHFYLWRLHATSSCNGNDQQLCYFKWNTLYIIACLDSTYNSRKNCTKYPKSNLRIFLSYSSIEKNNR